MKVIDLLKISKNILHSVLKSGVNPYDYIYIELYDEYAAMRGAGEKVTYTVTVLAQKYGISERKVYALVKHFSADYQG